MSSAQLAQIDEEEPAGELLFVEGISKHFPGVQALADVSFAVRHGEVHALVGQNGAGKSTLAKCIAGVYTPDSGRIMLEGKEVRLSSPRRAFELGIATVHQRPQLLPALSVAENIALGELPVHKGSMLIDIGKAYEETAALLARLNVPIDVRAAVGTLTVAERQQVAIAKALHRRARLLILDEPTVCLDAGQIDRLFELVDELEHEHVSILYISHHLEEIFRIADRITVLRDGRLIATQPVAELSQDDVVTLMAGARVATSLERRAKAAAAVEEPVVALRSVYTDELDDVDLAVPKGEVVGITGLIGSGSHGVAQLLFGLAPLESGELMLAGEPYRPHGPKNAIDHGIFMVPEDARDGLVPLLSLAANVTLVDLDAVGRCGFLSLRRERDLARTFVSELSIATPSVDTPVRGLSGGNQQKVLMAKSLAARASVLVLAEPTQGIDVRAKSEIHRLTRDLAAKGKTVIVVSTDVKDLLEYVDRIVAFREHRVVADLPVAETSYAEVLDLTIGAEAKGRP